jgi:hypothetical protein
MEKLHPEIQALLDKQAITEQLIRYCRGVDRLDRALLESVYWPEAVDYHGAFTGGVTAFIDYVFDLLKDATTQHSLGNVLIEFIDETHARAESYVEAYHEMGDHVEVVHGRYIDLWEKRGADWRIRDRIVAIDTDLVDDNRTDWIAGRYKDTKNRGGKKPNDPLYRIFK